MQIVTLYKCEACDNEYEREELARACEADQKACEFAVGDLVFYEGEPGSSFTRAGGTAVKVKKVTIVPRVSKDLARQFARLGEIGHSYSIELAATISEWGHPIVTSPYWLDKVDGPQRDRRG
jgi:hypothetical protein